MATYSNIQRCSEHRKSTKSHRFNFRATSYKRSGVTLFLALQPRSVLVFISWQKARKKQERNSLLSFGLKKLTCFSIKQLDLIRFKRNL